SVPRGEVVRTPDEAAAAFERLIGPAGRAILKVQAWITGRAAKGGIVFARSAAEAREAAARLLSLRFGNFPVTELLIEETIDIRDELFVSLTIDDVERAP